MWLLKVMKTQTLAVYVPYITLVVLGTVYSRTFVSRIQLLLVWFLTAVYEMTLDELAAEPMVLIFAAVCPLSLICCRYSWPIHPRSALA